ncbi:MAG TPA: LOG family protein [Phycisphaerae bacterium]|nr:LOG family protein [Phycisphaerae bacterium]HOJ73553.1 LOG family protein [Phycisphaerae bacterium]HOM51639.1 LOG family protein [Phycisphaerae bacterium]HON67649.1 LOG family protein [Phycisphaerae bacterium]HOQ85367.1 LOG family protein [Phycisphaerae bacterium]
MEDTELDAGAGPSRRIERAKAIEAFLDRFAPSADKDLLADMMVTICRLAADKTDRGELKLLNKALKELRYAFKVFSPYREVRKVSIFGSSRTPPGHPDYVQADNFARIMRQLNWMVITGAGDGIMRAGHLGAGREASFGVAIRLPFEQRTNTIIADDPKLVNFKYFFTRKLLFIKEASAIALFPGGFGTQDEGFEALVLIQTGKAALVPVVLVDAPGGTYWQHWRTYVQAELLRTNMISPEDMNLFRVTDDVQVAAKEITDFYKRYHSSRYVAEKLVLRLNTPLSNQALEELNDKYSSIVTAGKIEQWPGPLDGEDNEYPDKVRLTLTFDRRSIGTLRLLINDVNKLT